MKAIPLLVKKAIEAAPNIRAPALGRCLVKDTFRALMTESVSNAQTFQFSLLDSCDSFEELVDLEDGLLERSSCSHAHRLSKEDLYRCIATLYTIHCPLGHVRALPTETRDERFISSTRRKDDKQKD